jgi:hypothetical protein
MMSPSRDSDDLSELRDLAVDVDPPRELEDRVVAELRRRRLIGPGAGGSRSDWRSRLAVAAGLLLAALGGWVARGVVEAAPVSPASSTSTAATPPAGKEYMLILTEPEGLETDKELPELVAEYRAWAGGLMAEDRLVTMRRLDRGARDLTAGGGAPIEVSATPFEAEATGFFLVRAASLDEAVSVAAGCPHVGYGGRISVSQVARGER